MNKVFLIGRLGGDPEMKSTKDGTAVARFNIAVDNRYDKDKPAQWFTVICFRQTAEFVSRYLSKGRKVAVEGSLQTRSYDAQDGSKRFVTEVIADNVEFCDSKPEGGQKSAAPKNDEFVELDDDSLDSLPF